VPVTTIWAPLAGLGAFAGVEPGIVIRSGKGVEAWGELAAGPKTAAIVAGCGFEPDRLGRDMALAALSSGRPTVIDGGGLSAFAEEPDKLFALSGPGTVLTPHAGEFGRLFPDLGQGSRIDRALAAARRSRAVLVLKGADTIIPHPGARLCG
jgi:NAD(P)H-hydrate epimerase